MTRRRASIAIGIVVLAGMTACSRRARAPQALALPDGIGVWFADGIGAGDSAIEETLERVGIAAVYFPARRLTSDGAEPPPSQDLPAPARPLTRIPVVLIVESAHDPLSGADGERGKEFGGVLAREITTAVGRRAAFGEVRAILLDVPFSADSAQAHAAALREARSRLSHLLARGGGSGAPAGSLPILISMRRRPPTDEKGKKSVRALVSRSDGIVAFVFGDDNDADVTFVDSLGKPWWAAYASTTTGSLRRRSGGAGVAVPEAALDALTDDPSTQLLHELPWNAGRGSEFTLRATRNGQISGLPLSAGDSVVFSQPSLADLLARFRADTSGRRLARGRILMVAGASDTGRLFPVAALGDVISGRPAAPELRGWIARGGALLRVGAENPSPHASIVSRVQNWIEVELAPARLADLAVGGFDRWEAYDDRGHQVSPGRATRVRLYETFVAPFEQLEPARLTIRGRLPGSCCPLRTHLAPAAGGEIATDWAAAGEAGAAAKPTPSP